MNTTADSQVFADIPRTKFHLPIVRPHALHRKELMQALQQGMHRKLTLLSAPAGFGKTTLAASYLASVPSQAIWISLNARDDDPVRLCRVLAAAFSTYLSNDIVKHWSALDWTLTTSNDSFLTTLLNLLEQVPAPFCLALDDWHEIESQPCQELLAEFIERCPAHGHILITTRQRPSLPLHRWRARDWVQEFNAEALRFAEDEVVAFFHNTMQLPLTPADCQLLQERTKGWVAGLQLAGLSLRHYPSACLQSDVLSSNNPYLSDYLKNEVLQRLSPKDQEFLLQTSILNQLCGPLCDQLTGQRDGAERLQWLEQNNLFVSTMSPKQEWYCLHPLWAEFLQHELAQIWPERLANLHQRACEWLAQHNFREEAVEHAIASQRWDFCLALLIPYLEELLFRQEFYRVQTLVEKLPSDIRRQYPSASICWLWACLGLGDWHTEMEQELESLLQHRSASLDLPKNHRQTIAPTTPLDDADKKTLPPESIAHEEDAELLFLRANLASFQGDFAASIRHAQQAFARLPSHRIHMRFTLLVMLGRDPSWLATQEGSDIWFAQGLQTIEPFLSSTEQRVFFQHKKQIFQSWLAYHSGQLQQAILELVAYEKALSKQKEPYIHLETSVLLAYFYWEQGKQEEALVALKKAERLFDLDRYDGVAIGFYQTAALVYHTAGEPALAYTCLEQVSKQRIQPSARDLLMVEQTHLYLKSLEGDMQYLADWVYQSGIDASDLIDLAREEKQFAYLILAWVLFVENRLEELESLLARMTEQMHPASQVPLAITLQISWALLRGWQGQRTQSFTHLREALRLASHGIYLSPFFTQEALLCDLLSELLQTPEELENTCSHYFLARLTERLPSLTESSTKTTSMAINSQHQVSASDQAVALSKREIEILTVAAQGETYREIAKSLHISAETVKRHMKNIFQKLQVNNRTQALNKARDLRLFAPTS